MRSVTGYLERVSDGTRVEAKVAKFADYTEPELFSLTHFWRGQEKPSAALGVKVRRLGGDHMDGHTEAL